ncbi:MAG: CoA transferase [Hyphomicrobiales bacterium]|nr:CoA transferase [Hyphomicrobiales bacterium]
MTASAALGEIWRSVDAPEDLLADVVLTGADPVLPSSFRIGLSAQMSIAASALAAADLWRLRSGRRQLVSVDMRHAAIEFRSERYLRVDGKAAPEPWDKIAGFYHCGKGGFVRLHTNFPHHRDGILKLLACAYDRESVAEALRRWNAFEFEEKAAEAAMVVAALRSFEAWDDHPQSQALSSLPLVAIDKLGEARPEPLAPAERPLSGVRVLDLTRVIAGPVCGRTLAAHGAQVLLVAAPHLPSIEQLVIDTGRGKRSTHLDLRDEAHKETLQGLLSKADIFVQGFRPGTIAARGFGPREAARLRPGIVYVSLSAYGQKGPWSARRGFDSLVQTASGLNDAEARAAGSELPTPLPAQALDHATGYLMAFGSMAALARRAREGGSWHVQLSLARTAQWLRSLGRIEDGFACADPREDDVTDCLEETPSRFGRLRAVRHAAILAETPARWERPSVPLGSDAPAWED